MTAIAASLEAMARDVVDTPCRAFLSGAAEDRYAEICSRLDGFDAPVEVLLATSVKTNPEPKLLAVGRRHGAYAEVISPGEVALALQAGFTSHQIIYNGPLRCKASMIPGPAAFAFADSIEALNCYLDDAVADVTGIRIRPAGVQSRFGVPIACSAEIGRLLQRFRPKRFALSFHVRPQDYGGRTWSQLASTVIAAGVELSEKTGTPIVALDGGGGWTPSSLDELLDTELARVAQAIHTHLPFVRQLILEPGQAIATPTEALLTTVVEVRQRHAFKDVVVDATVALLPMIEAYQHRIYAIVENKPTLLQDGPDRILGCACLENDILARGVTLPNSLAEGDRIIIADCGSYDASMAFAFAGHEFT